MENQHRKIDGYRELSQADIDLMNEGKRLAEVCRLYVEKLNHADDADPRWVAIGRTHRQEGFMAVVRGIAKSSTFQGSRAIARHEIGA